LAIPFPSQHQTLIHYYPSKLQPDPFRKFLHAYSKLLKLKAGDFPDTTEDPCVKTMPSTYQPGLIRMNQQSGPHDKIALVRVHDGGSIL